MEQCEFHVEIKNVSNFDLLKNGWLITRISFTWALRIDCSFEFN